MLDATERLASKFRKSMTCEYRRPRYRRRSALSEAQIRFAGVRSTQRRVGQSRAAMTRARCSRKSFDENNAVLHITYQSCPMGDETIGSNQAFREAVSMVIFCQERLSRRDWSKESDRGPRFFELGRRVRRAGSRSQGCCRQKRQLHVMAHFEKAH